MEDFLEQYLQVCNNTKDKEKEVNPKIRQDILITPQRKKECENIAAKIVEFLMDGQLQPAVFLRCLRSINQDIYQDVVEERAITNICGYPICGNRIPEMPKKQYYIAVKAKKVYDISERKNFCSNFCYKASLHIKNQIDTSPLWLRFNEDPVHLNLLPATTIGIPGDIIDNGLVRPVIEPEFTSVSSFAQISLNEVEDIETTPKNYKMKTASKVKVPKEYMETITEQEDTTCVEEDSEIKEEIEADYKIGKVVVAKKYVNNSKQDELGNINDNDDSSTNKVTNVQKITNGIQNLNISNGACSKSKKKEQKLRKPTLEELIAKHKEKQKLNTKTIKTIDILDVDRTNSSEKCGLGKSNKCENTTSQKIEVKEYISDIPKVNSNKCMENILNTYPEKQVGVEATTSKNLDDNIKDVATYKILKNITFCLKLWLTIDSYIYLYGEEKIRHILNEKKLDEYFEKLKITELDTSKQMKYMEICRRLQLRELAEEKFDRSVLGNRVQPIPDYKKLKDESKDMDLKVKSFYCGVLYEKPDSNNDSINKKIERENEGSPAVLPLVDVSSQHALRRKVFLNSVNKTLQIHINELQMDSAVVFAEVQSLVKTFKFTSKNIIFKPVQWNIIALTLLKIVSFREESFEKHLAAAKCQEYFNTVFNKFPDYQIFLSNISSIVENVNSFVEDFITANNC